MRKITIGLINQTTTLQDAEFLPVAAALHTQISRDVSQFWDVAAEIVSLGTTSSPPAGVSPIIVVDAGQVPFAGEHMITQGVPWAMVSTKRDWALAASHECVELLIDPTGEAVRNSIGLELVDGLPQEIGTRFDYLLEACDPIEDADHAYEIGGIRVSDFYTPHYFDDAPVAGARYSFNGALTRPREVRPGGYLSWRDPVTGKYRQLRNFAGFSIFEVPDRQDTSTSTRQFIDSHTPTPRTHPELFPRRSPNP